MAHVVVQVQRVPPKYTIPKYTRSVMVYNVKRQTVGLGLGYDVGIKTFWAVIMDNGSTNTTVQLANPSIPLGVSILFGPCPFTIRFHSLHVSETP